MWGFLTADANLIFSIALMIMVLITMIEVLSTLVGGGLSSAVDSLFPDLDVDMPDIDVDADTGGTDFDAQGSLAALMSWLNVGRVPFLVLFMIFLTSFGLTGLAIQGFSFDILGIFWPGLLAAVPAFAASLPVTRVTGALVGKLIPKDETTAVSQDSLIGRVATLVLGDAKAGSAAQAKVGDQHGKDHYVLVEPDNKTDIFEQGQMVLLVRRSGGTYFAIGDVNEHLTS